ncbi:enoyl-CoA hydratase/isomerase family protein [Burkholderia sp. BCC1993]|uniref:enoyl-CoA hydratase/isomerase family protein n=1 Tax=Burkholderia sp. BCC1993 TaxID=2817444 RepID=UPI002AB08078|nr:enoyl-CoA hydratase-related protein [Burkholderia sp. BCC1993]
MTTHAVLLDIHASTGVATVTLNRPTALNALDYTLTECLRDAVGRVEFDDEVRAVVLQSAGEHFMAGGDIKTFHATLRQPPDERRRLFERFISDVHESIIRIRRMEKPVVASVRGAVAGFGLSLMNSCDLVVAATDSYFTMAYCNIGASPDGSGTYGLPRVVGLKRAMEIALLGDRFDAQRALELGLVNRVVPTGDLVDTTRALAARLAAGPTRALGRTKRLLNESLNRTLSEQLLAEQESFVACVVEADFANGVQAFVEKRKPQFEGR